MEPEQERFADALAAALAADIATEPPPGDLVRVIVRWFDEANPLYFTAHALGSEEQGDIDASDAWYPLEWPNADRELERADRIGSVNAVREAGEAISHEDDDDFVEAGADDLAPVVIVEVVRRLPAALRAVEVKPSAELAITAEHFEGYGALAVLQATADPSTLAALDAAGLLPDE